jgi:hypothetical protein
LDLKEKKETKMGHNFYLQRKIISVSLKPYPVMVEIAGIIA